MNLILFDDATRHALLPFTHTRPVADIRCGILTMRERWEHLAATTTSTFTEAYLQEVYPLTVTADNCWINGSIFATRELMAAIGKLPPDSKLMADDLLIAARMPATDVSYNAFAAMTDALPATSYEGEVLRLQHKWDIFSHNETAIEHDFILLTEGRSTALLPEGVTVTGKENIFLEPTAIVQPGTVINAMGGPVYIGAGAEIMEGCLIRGPFAIGENAVLKMGAKVYRGTTLGPGCKVGGEISNVVFFANSNKGHDGFLGNSVIGEWCNLGADTNSSNLKNNYDAVKIWDEHLNKSVKTGLTFCGLLMGDHSKCAINTMFNTGTVAGVSCNIYGGNFPEKFIPSFAWGGSEGAVTYDFKRAMDTARRMMARRHLDISPAAEKMYQAIFERTQQQRDFMLGK